MLLPDGQVISGTSQLHLTIHIGPHKTGTTALQAAFAGGARALRRRGVLYPRSNWLHQAQHRLAFALKRGRIPGTSDAPDRDAEVAALVGNLRRRSGDRVFLSSEEFFSCPPDAIAWFSEQLEVESVRVLAFLRRPDNFLVSCYNQKVRQPGNGFDAPIQRFVRNPRQIAPEIDYLACVSAWASVFGDDCMQVETYEAGPPLARALKALGLPEDTLQDTADVNTSVPGAVAETMRLAKSIGLSEPRQRHLLKLSVQVYSDEPAYYLSDEDRLRIIRTFETDNAALFKRIGQQNPYLSRDYTPVPFAKDHNLNHHDLMRLIARLL